MDYYKEWIVRYHGKLTKALTGLDATVNIINKRYAIIKIPQEEVTALKGLLQIEKIEKSRAIDVVASKVKMEQIIGLESEKLELTGKGVTIGWISHQERINHKQYRTSQGKSRIRSIYDGTKAYHGNQITKMADENPQACQEETLVAMDLCAGNNGISPESDIILVNWSKDKIYTADALRALCFIIKNASVIQKPLVIYFPFDISNGTGINNSMMQEIVSQLILQGKITIVSTLATNSMPLEKNLSLNTGPIFARNGMIAVGALALIMEWGIVKSNDPFLYGQKLRTTYIKNLALPCPKEMCYRTLDLAYDLAPGEAEIDVFIVYNHLKKEELIKTTQAATVYPLLFPYLGVRGTVSAIKEIFDGYLETLITGSLAYILGNEPLDIKETNFQSVKILKTPTDLKGKGTLIGIIDSGIDYTHPAFINDEGKTRILSIWDQTIGDQSPYGYGTIYDEDQINRALASSDPCKVIPHEDEWGNGTMLAGIAAGYYKDGQVTYKGVAPEASIVVVKLQPATPAMQEIYYDRYNPRGFSALDIARGFEYMSSLANQYQQPISICLPMGTNSGSHDGASILDTIVMSYGENPGVAVILPAGEEANKAHHASGTLKENEEQQIKLIIAPGEKGFIVEIWVTFGDRIDATLISPPLGSIESRNLLLNTAQLHTMENDCSVWSQGSKIDTDTGSQVIRFRLNNPWSGEWIIKIKGIVVFEGKYNIWIPKTGMILPQTILSPADPFTTIYNTSAARGVITVACYDKKSLSPTASSGRGFARADEVKPDFMVPGVDIPGPLPGNKWGSATGTAISSAITAGITAIIYQDQLLMGKEIANSMTMKALLIEQVKREPTIVYPDPSRGYGLLDISTVINNKEEDLNLKVRVSKDEELGALAIPYDLIPEDEKIDVFIVYNSSDSQTNIIPPPNVTLYPLSFPYLGVRGPRKEIEEIFTKYLGKKSLGLIPFVLGNEPLNIAPWDFKATSFLKSPVGFGGTNTLIGIIDTGIDYTNPAFKDKDGNTRIISIWDQTIGTESPSGYGSVYDQEMINKALKSPNPFEVVPHQDKWGHGTILAGIAAGSGNYEQGSYTGIAPGAELVIVKLKPASDGMQRLYYGRSNPLAFSALDIALATEFLANVASKMQKPISICLPMGTNSGGHDGSNILDSIISNYSLNPSVCTILSVGEEADKKHHVAGDLKEADNQEIKLTIAQGQVSFACEIWASFGDEIEVLLIPPSSKEGNLRPVNLNKFQKSEFSLTASVWSTGIKLDEDTGCQYIRLRFENPVAGDYILTVKGIIIVEGRYDIWLPKTGMILPGTVLWPDSPFTTIYNTSAAKGIISIGCYDEKSQSACASSGRGLTRDNRPSPDYLADGVDIPGPLPNNKWGLISGSAPASAIAVGVTSLIYESQLKNDDNLANTIVMKALLISRVKRESTVLYPNPSSGYGVIDINSNMTRAQEEGLDPRMLHLPYDLLPEDALIDIFIILNNFDEQIKVPTVSGATIYPLGFPYSGVRGTRAEIEAYFANYIETTNSELISFIWSNQPINIQPWRFKTTSILKPNTDLDGKGTLIGIIDTGIDYTNVIFNDQNGETRIQSIWDQTIGGDSPYGYGTVYDREKINAALKTSDPFEIVPHKDEWGHGTILAGIAAGAGQYEEGAYRGIAPGAELIIVKLKPASEAMQKLYYGKYNSLGVSALDIALAYQYIVNLANQIKKPVSICLPSGTNSGSHDGTNILDSIISNYSSNPGICSVMSVGEEADKDHHASGDLKENKEQEIKLTVAKGQVGFIAEIWAHFNDQIEVTLVPPKTEEMTFPNIVLNKNQTVRITDDSSVWSQGIKIDENTGAQLIHFRFENPIAGQWGIKIKGIVVADGQYNIWIPKTGMILPGTVLSPASPFTTIYNTSASKGVIAIGCRNRESLSACASSGRGYTRDNRVCPDYIVNGVDIPGPLPDNKWGQITGTAPSSAITVGVTSLIYEDQLVKKGALANTTVMKAILAANVKRQPTLSYPNPSSGYGIIDINLDLP